MSMLNFNKSFFIHLFAILSVFLVGCSSSNIDKLEKLALEGDKQAQLQLADAYYDAEFVWNKYEKAAFWYEKASNNGVIEATRKLATIYLHGKGEPKDEKKALKLFEQAAKKGDAHSQYLLGLLLYDSMDIYSKDRPTLDWYLKAAKQEHALAQLGVGQLLKFTASSAEDYIQAAYWLEKAFINRKNKHGLNDSITKYTLYELLEILYSLTLIHDNGVDKERDTATANKTLSLLNRYIGYLPKAEQTTYDYLIQQLESDIGKTLTLQLKSCDINVRVFTEMESTGLAQYYIKSLRQSKAHQNINVCLSVTPAAGVIEHCYSESCVINFETVENQLNQANTLIFASEQVDNLIASAFAYSKNIIITRKMPDAAIIQHELMHLYGFKDEYELNQDAVFFCGIRNNYTYANLFFGTKGQSSDYIKAKAKWPKGESVEISEAKTCANTENFVAYKPVQETTILERGLHIPDLYQALVEEKLKTGDKSRGGLFLDIGKYYRQDIDIKTKIKWLKKAAEKNNRDAYFELGSIFESKEPPIQDYKKAAYWYLKAAKRGHSTAQMFLSGLYQFGDGVDKDAEKSKYWYEQSQLNEHKK
jgi:uncharacterized protein